MGFSGYPSIGNHDPVQPVTGVRYGARKKCSPFHFRASGECTLFLSKRAYRYTKAEYIPNLDGGKVADDRAPLFS